MSFWSRKLLFAINFSERRFQLDDIMVVVIWVVVVVFCLKVRHTQALVLAWL